VDGLPVLQFLDINHSVLIHSAEAGPRIHETVKCTTQLSVVVGVGNGSILNMNEGLLWPQYTAR
jgi:hypothetical protein